MYLRRRGRGENNSLRKRTNKLLAVLDGSWGGYHKLPSVLNDVEHDQHAMA